MNLFKRPPASALNDCRDAMFVTYRGEAAELKRSIAAGVAARLGLRMHVHYDPESAARAADAIQRQSEQSHPGLPISQVSAGEVARSVVEQGGAAFELGLPEGTMYNRLPMTQFNGEVERELKNRQDGKGPWSTPYTSI